MDFSSYLIPQPSHLCRQIDRSHLACYIYLEKRNWLLTVH